MPLGPLVGTRCRGRRRLILLLAFIEVGASVGIDAQKTSRWCYVLVKLFIV